MSGYIEAGLSDHKPVCVEMKRTDIRAQAALPDRSVPKGGGQGFPLAVRHPSFKGMLTVCW